MQSDALPHLIDVLLRLPLLEAGQLRELIQSLPEPEASARDMLGRGWITQEQFSSLFPAPQEQPTARETVLVGFGDDDLPPDADADNWDLALGDEEDKAGESPEPEPARVAAEEAPAEPETVEAVPAPCGATSDPQFEWGALAAAPAAVGVVTQRPATDPDKLLKQWMGWTCKALLVWVLFAGSYFAGLQFIRGKSTPPVVARQASPEAKKKSKLPAERRVVIVPQIAAAKAEKVPDKAPVEDPDGGIDRPPPAEAGANVAKQREDVSEPVVQNGLPGVPAATPQVGTPTPAAAPQGIWQTVSQVSEEGGYPQPPDAFQQRVGQNPLWARQNPQWTRQQMQTPQRNAAHRYPHVQRHQTYVRRR